MNIVLPGQVVGNHLGLCFVIGFHIRESGFEFSSKILGGMTDAANYHQVAGHAAFPDGGSNVTAKGNGATEEYQYISLFNAIFAL